MQKNKKEKDGDLIFLSEKEARRIAFFKKSKIKNKKEIKKREYENG